MSVQIDNETLNVDSIKVPLLSPKVDQVDFGEIPTNLMPSYDVPLYLSPGFSNGYVPL